MKKRRSTNQTFKSVAGSALAGPGLFILFGHLAGIAGEVHQVVGNAAGQGLAAFSSVVLAATLDQQWWLQAVLGVLWPLLLVIGGAVLLNDDSDACEESGARVAGIPNPCGCASEGC